MLAYETNESSADDERKLSEKPGSVNMTEMLCREVWGVDLGLEEVMKDICAGC